MNAAQERLKFWRPCPLEQLELLQGTTVTSPCCQQFTQSYVIGTIQSGKGILQYRNTSLELTRGALYVIEPEEIWSCQAEALTFFHLLVEPTLLQHGASEIVGTGQPWSHLSNLELHHTTLSLLLENLFASFTVSISRLEQQDLLLQVVSHLLLPHIKDREESGLKWEHSAIQRAKTYVAEHYTEDVSLETLASIAHLSEFHLSRLFRQVVGLPPHAYQVQLRLSHARKLLAQGCSVNYVAHETGFFDQSHFASQFKRHFGVSPGTYRKTARFYEV